MTAVEKALGDAYSEPAADVRGFVAGAKRRDRITSHLWNRQTSLSSGHASPDARWRRRSPARVARWWCWTR